MQFLKDKVFLIILTLAVVIRLFWCFGFPTYPETDFMWYHAKATELSEGKGFLNGVYPTYEGVSGKPTAFRTIGYPLTLASIYYFTGSNFIIAKLLNIVFSAISIIIIYLISRKYFSRKVSLWATALFAFLPLSIVYTGIIGSETLFQALLVLIAYLILFNKNPVLIGLVSGYLSLVRPIGIYFLAVIAVFYLLNKNFNLKEKSIKIATIICVTLLVLSPWLIRNYIQFGKPLYSTNGGYVIYVNNNPYATGSWSDPYKYPDSPFLKYKNDTWFDEVGMHEEGKKLAIEWIKENPKEFIKLGIIRIKNSYWSKLDDVMWGFTIGVNEWSNYTSAAIKLENWVYKPFYILTFISILIIIYKFLRKKATDFDILVLGIFLYFNAMMFGLEGNSRYVFPLHTFYSLIVVATIFREILTIQKNNITNTYLK